MRKTLLTISGAVLVLTGCPASRKPFEPAPVFHKLSPYRAGERGSLAYAARYFQQIYGPSPARLGGLQPVRPGLGLPTWVTPGGELRLEYLAQGPVARIRAVAGSLAVHLIQRGGDAPKTPLQRVRVVSAQPLVGRVVHVVVAGRVPGAQTPGFYDLEHRVRSARVQIRSAVQILTRPAARARPFLFVHLTDVHQGGHGWRHLARVVDGINRLEPRPAFVILTGDVVEYGPNPKYWKLVVQGLTRLQVPVFVVPGNHDYYRVALGKGKLPPRTYIEELGLRFFMRHLHPYLTYRFQFGGYRFLALDTGSGATMRTLRYWQLATLHGLGPAQLQDIRAFLRQPGAGHVLFGHAPPRARMSLREDGCRPGKHAVFIVGRREFERALVRSHRRRPRPVLYLHGHTHWNDLYGRSRKPGCRFSALPFRRQMMGTLPCWRGLPMRRSPLIVSTQSGTKHNSLRSGGWHESGLTLGEGAGAAYGFRVLRVRGTVWQSALLRFYHRSLVRRRTHPEGYIDPRAFKLNNLSRCR